MTKFTTILLTGITALAFTACGGGGSTSGSGGETTQPPASGTLPPTNGTPVPPSAITDQNADQVLAATTLSMQGITHIDDLLGEISASSMGNNMAKAGLSGNIASSDHAVAPLAESGTESCTGGGTVSYSFSNTQGSYTFNNCNETDIGLTLDGSISMTIKGNDISAQYTNFSLKLHHQDTSLYYESASVNINRNSYDMSGIVTGWVDSEGTKVEVKNYSFSKTGNSYTYNGLVKTNCIDFWIDVKTTQEIKLSNDSNGCPIAGEVLVIATNSELKTVFHSDQSIDVYLNGESYATYSD